MGLTSDYSMAQRLYIKRGYIPDGKGIFYENRKLKYGDEIVANDEVCLYLIKNLRK